MIQPGNVASERVATKIGLRYERDVAFGTRWERFGRLVRLYATNRP